MDYNLHCSVAFGSYAQTRNLTTNDMCAHTTGAIAMGPSTNFQGGVEFYSLELANTLNRSKNDYTLAPMPADAILRVTRLAKDMPNGLHFTDRLGNPHMNDPENNPGPITIRFVDTPPDSQNTHDQQITQEDAENNEIDNLTNNTTIDLDNITIRITGVTNEENNKNENTINNSIQDDNNPIKDHDYGCANTAEDIKQTGVGSQDETRPAGVTITDHDIKTTGVEDQTTPLQTKPEIDTDPDETEEQYEYFNLRGVFGDIPSNKTVE